MSVFDDSATTPTVNGTGWEVQQHTMPAGWSAISAAHKTFNEARAEMLRMPSDGSELRVYEALLARVAS